MDLIIQGLITGISAGFISGLLGMGGGSILVPAIMLIFNLPMKLAVGTSLFVIVFSALSSLISYFRHNKVYKELTYFIVPTGIIGAQAGAFLASRLSDILVKHIFTLLVAGLGIRMLLQKDSVYLSEKTSFNNLAAAIIGFIAGFVSGLSGVGGATLIIPLLYLLLKIPMHICIGTAVAAILFNALSGSAGYIIRGLVDFRIGILLAIGSTIAAPLGARLSIKTSAEKLRKIFAIALILSSIAVLLKK